MHHGFETLADTLSNTQLFISATITIGGIMFRKRNITGGGYVSLNQLICIRLDDKEPFAHEAQFSKEQSAPCAAYLINLVNAFYRPADKKVLNPNH